MNQKVFSQYSDMLTVGKIWGATPKRGKQFSNPKKNELSIK